MVESSEGLLGLLGFCMLEMKTYERSRMEMDNEGEVGVFGSKRVCVYIYEYEYDALICHVYGKLRLPLSFALHM